MLSDQILKAKTLNQVSELLAEVERLFYKNSISYHTYKKLCSMCMDQYDYIKANDGLYHGYSIECYNDYFDGYFVN